MCNLYSITKGQQAIRVLAGAMRDNAGNMTPLPGVFPDYPAPIVRNAPDGVRELTMARRGTPSPIFALKGSIPPHPKASQPDLRKRFLRNAAQSNQWSAAN
jgi:putative SOS response-associated peptidase YedK